MNNKEKDRKAWAEIVARAWTDEKFKKRLFSHPEEVFKEYGIQVKKGAHYKIIEEAPSEITIILPKKPENMSDEELKRVAAGAGVSEATVNVAIATEYRTGAGPG